jgi:hypothetical protein
MNAIAIIPKCGIHGFHRYLVKWVNNVGGNMPDQALLALFNLFLLNAKRVSTLAGNQIGHRLHQFQSDLLCLVFCVRGDLSQQPFIADFDADPICRESA